MERVKLGILASGGMDSFLVWSLYKEATNIYVRLGHKYQLKEIKALFRLSKELEGFKVAVVDGPPMGALETPSGIIPMRNAELILSASHVADRIMLGVLKDETDNDKSAEFFSSMETVLNVSWRSQPWNDNVGRNFQVYSPIRNYTKAQLIKLYVDHGNDPANLSFTVSCYSDTQHHCGACPSCAQRWIALRLNNLEHLNQWEKYPAYYIKDTGLLSKAQNGAYRPERAAELLLAMKETGLA